MNPVLFSIGGFTIKWYSVLILAGVLLAMWLFLKEGKKHNYPGDFLFNLCF